MRRSLHENVATVLVDPRIAFKVRSSLVVRQRGDWHLASDSCADHVRFHRRLGGVRPIPMPHDRAL